MYIRTSSFFLRAEVYYSFTSSFISQRSAKILAVALVIISAFVACCYLACRFRVKPLPQPQPPPVLPVLEDEEINQVVKRRFPDILPVHPNAEEQEIPAKIPEEDSVDIPECRKLIPLVNSDDEEFFSALATPSSSPDIEKHTPIQTPRVVPVVVKEDIFLIPKPPSSCEKDLENDVLIAGDVRVDTLGLEDSEELTCPITCEPFQDPYILLEDGFTYEKAELEKWVREHPSRSPMIGYIYSATIMPNYMLQKKPFICPITQTPFQEPYYCVEDGQTYERSAILKWCDTKIQEIIDDGLFMQGHTTICSPTSGRGFTTITLYPNKVLFPMGIPITQIPLQIDVNQCVGLSFQEDFGCVFDPVIRRLLEDYSTHVSNPIERGEDSDKQYNTRYYEHHEEQLRKRKKIHERRRELGLPVRRTATTGIFKSIDLSYLDLSNMHLCKLDQKCAIFKRTNLSHSTFENCSFDSIFFLCDMRKTIFLNCNFGRGKNTFFKTDMQEVVIGAGCSLEKGSSWKPAQNPDEFRQELSRRGALNTDSITFL